MHIDPKQGIVDLDCRIHSVDNLYIASSSVFPTNGAGVPTLTTVALAIRLADHIKEVMRS
jgi:choline dehydrogenase-like flavoprotein